MEKSVEDYSVEETLLDGRIIHIRALKSTDRDNILDIWQHLSSQSRYYRFFSPKKFLTDKELDYYTNIDYKTHLALLALIPETNGENPVGVGRYIAIDKKKPHQAEVAFIVEDQFHNLGIATILLKHLMKLAKDRGITEFVAFILNENKAMIEVLENSGLPISQTLADAGTREVKLDLTKHDSLSGITTQKSSSE